MDEIRFFDRYEQRLSTEKVYGDAALKWTYNTFPGRLTLEAVIKRALFSRWYGWRMNRPASREKVLPFVSEYGLDPQEFVRRPEEFRTFNEFFYRQLKPEARPVSPGEGVAVFPADGRHLCVPDLTHKDGLFVKGEMFSLGELLADDDLCRHFEGGSLLLSRLCPVDYHRFHFPVAGTAGPSRLINGPLYSVNPIALRQNIQILATNKRELTVLETETYGRVLLLEIGATCVGTICQTFSPGTRVSKGDEKGYFKFGGSSTITIFERGRIEFADDLVENSLQQRELFARMGDHMAKLL